MSLGPASVLQRLREETREEHEAVERDLDWEWHVAERGRYRALLARFHGFHAALEPRIAAALEEAAFFDPRRRLDDLVADLVALGLTPQRIAGLPLCRGAPNLSGPSEALGALYVLEGSTLGGQIIARRVARDLGLAPHTGCAYYAAHGRETGTMWRDTRARLAAQAESGPAAADAMVSSARATFAALRAWLREDRALADAAASA